ncbi:MAG: helix-turn-helix domain-containing protein [Lachnospiraceae bacterium]|nr:helix-turn-helix domain-containing protein [Lachnospiraceae bacterium]
MEMAEVVMNPVRQRIFQYFLLHETGTVKEIRKALPDVPSASLYRHIKILADSSILMVVGENRIRGTVESVYQLNKDAMATEDENGNAVQMSLLGICASFARYFSSGNADPRKDMLLFTSCTLRLTDEEFSDFLSEINQVAVKYMKKEAVKDSKTRQITLISAPPNE